LKGFGGFGRRRAHEEEAAVRRAEYEEAAARHATAERDRQEQLAAARAAHDTALAQEVERVLRQHATIDRQERDFAEGRPSAVAAYFREVLSVQSYPGDFPTGIQIGTSLPSGNSWSALTCRC
jgi:hypothetical protein